MAKTGEKEASAALRTGRPAAGLRALMLFEWGRRSLTSVTAAGTERISFQHPLKWDISTDSFVSNFCFANTTFIPPEN